MKLQVVVVVVVAAFLQANSARSTDLPTLVPVYPFDSGVDARTLHDAMAGLGTNEASIINVLCYRTFTQRHEITLFYNNLYDVDLDNALDIELSSQFKDLMVSMTYSFADYTAMELRKMMTVLGTDEKSILEVLLSKKSSEITSISDSYDNLYGVTLVSAIESHTSGSSNTILVSLAQGHRDDSSTVDEDLVLADVDSLYLAGANSTGTNVVVFTNIFTSRNFAHLRRVFDVYQARYGQSMETVIGTEFSGTVMDLMNDIVQYARDKYRYFAQRFHESMAGIGTRDDDLKRLTVSRCEIELGNIKSAYEQLYGKTLRDAVSSETSGNYRNGLLALIG